MIFTCERCKIAPLKNGFRRPYQWKTETGFNNHKCYTVTQEKRDKTRAANKDLVAQKRAEAAQAAEERRRIEYEAAMKVRVETAKHRPGDFVYAVFYRVTKGTHEQRYNRLVRVRYEEERSYQACEMVITEITLHGYLACPKGMTFPSQKISDADIFPSMPEAVTAFQKRAAQYKEHCERADFCR